MHSSRMRTGRSLTVCCSLLPGGVVPGPGGVSGPGGCVCSWGVSGLGGVSASGRVPGLGGSAPWGGLVRGVSQHALRQTPLPPCGQTHTCKNITLAQLRCGR